MVFIIIIFTHINLVTMAEKDPRVDAYIDNAADFAKPILTHLRKLVHAACPDATENIKWGAPHFEYNKSAFCSMAAFKNHCAFGFWKASIMSDPYKLLTGKESMGQFGKLSSLKDLPSDKVLKEYIKEAEGLAKDGVKLPKAKPALKKELTIPEAFTKALNKNKKAQKVFDTFSYSQKKEYAEWISEAKTDTTRDKRIETAVEWIAEGKNRNWKYEK